jgi:hypothetical protein
MCCGRLVGVRHLSATDLARPGEDGRMRVGVLLPLLALAACECVNITYATDYDASHIFGDRLDACRGVRVLCWPSDADGNRFRCVEDRIDRKIAEQAVMTWPTDVHLSGPAGSIIVILPPDVSPATRSRASRLLADLTRGSPRAGRHVVTADSSWQDVTGGRELAQRLQDMHTRAQEWRETSSDDGIFVTYEQISGLTPHAIVVPLEGDADRNLVLQGIRRNVLPLGGWQAASESVLSSAEIRSLPPLVSEEDEPRLMVIEVIVAEASGAAARARAMRLADDLLARGHTSVYLRTVSYPEIAQGVIYPGRLEPPYIADGQFDGETAE